MLSLLLAVIYVLPAYIANGTPVVVLRIAGPGHPLDMGIVMRDGRRLLGDGKTIEGLASGLSAGLAAAFLSHVFLPGVYRGLLECGLIPVGAMAGDILGSFLKRRLGVERGGSAPVLDQLGFLLMALLLAWIPYGPPGWADPPTIILLLLVTALLHVSTNALAYLAGLKERWY